ncbi:MAG: acyltransferase family protein, partial [Verrucomicrobiota bacterium JB023]|nr:acyltransferase family protein [Verrucomicrobiota bacterium JB023]
MSRVNRPHILCQTGIRGLAALSVVPSHLGLKYMFPESGATIAGFFPSGIAVNFFFVLSGFILCYVYMHDGRFSGSWNKFYRARFARIYPLYLCLILVGYLANLLAGT